MGNIMSHGIKNYPIKKSSRARPDEVRRAHYKITRYATTAFLSYDIMFIFVVRRIRVGRRDVAQPGSALRSGRRGRWFESSHPDFCKVTRQHSPLNRMV